MYCGAFAAVEHTELDASAVGAFCHFSAERIKLTDEMAFARAADVRVARQIADRVEVHCEADGFFSETRRSKGRFNSGMPRTYDRYII